MRENSNKISDKIPSEINLNIYRFLFPYDVAMIQVFGKMRKKRA